MEPARKNGRFYGLVLSLGLRSIRGNPDCIALLPSSKWLLRPIEAAPGYQTTTQTWTFALISDTPDKGNKGTGTSS